MSACVRCWGLCQTVSGWIKGGILCQAVSGWLASAKSIAPGNQSAPWAKQRAQASHLARPGGKGATVSGWRRLASLLPWPDG